MSAFRSREMLSESLTGEGGARRRTDVPTPPPPAAQLTRKSSAVLGVPDTTPPGAMKRL